MARVEALHIWINGEDKSIEIETEENKARLSGRMRIYVELSGCEPGIDYFVPVTIYLDGARIKTVWIQVPGDVCEAEDTVDIDVELEVGEHRIWAEAPEMAEAP